MLDLIKKVFPNTPKSRIDRFKNLPNKMTKSSINTPERIAGFLSQVGHESGGFADEDLAENLNYSQERLLAVFPKYFSPFQASYYKNKPEMIANRVYANRMGNGPEDSGDGYRYRGRGLIQLTGKSNYERCGKSIKVDLIANPDYIMTNDGAIDSAIWYWTTANCNKLADAKDIVALTRAINGGTNGLQDRQNLFKKFYELVNKNDAKSEAEVVSDQLTAKGVY